MRERFLLDELLQMRFALNERQFTNVFTIHKQQVESEV